MTETDKMNPTVKQQWVEALRGGNYIRGHNGLRRGNDTYCCLGVLCDLYHLTTGNGEWIEEELDVTTSYYRFLGDTTYLPPPVAEWSGLVTSNPRLPSGILSREGYLSEANDNGHSFKQIADAIEEHL